MRIFSCIAFVLSLLISTTTLAASYPTSDESIEYNSIPNEYIVVLKSEYNVKKFTAMEGETVLKKFDILNGMLIETSNPDSLKREGVAYVEPNVRMHILTDQANASWNLDRVDSRTGLDGIYRYGATGNGVHAYVIDTGLYASHNDFAGRIGKGYSAIPNSNSADCNGHGSHVAGTVMGTTYGLAKKAIIHPVRVLDCDGSGQTDWIISGIEWVVANAQKPAVANMSLGGNKTQAINDAVSKAIARGIVFVVAAGNSSDNSCNYSPASVPEAITVAASDRNDASASFTSYGSCVDVYAPGVGIPSVGISSPTATATMSGTSMASPLVAGAVALLLEGNPSATPAFISTQLINNSTRGIVQKVPTGTANLLLFTNPSSTPTPTPTPNPTPDAGIPTECNDAYMCYQPTGSLNPTTYYEVQPKSYVTVNYARPIKVYVKGTADCDLYLYYSNNGGNKWTEVARSTTTGLTESLTYQANTRGLYTLIVMLKTKGTSGTYNMWLPK